MCYLVVRVCDEQRACGLGLGLGDSESFIFPSHECAMADLCLLVLYVCRHALEAPLVNREL